MNCTICREEILPDQRVASILMQTFIFKPADVPDTVNAARVSPDELQKSRKDYTRTALAAVFTIYGRVPIPEGAFNTRHTLCMVERTASTSTELRPMLKHAIRYQRAAGKKMH